MKRLRVLLLLFVFMVPSTASTHLAAAGEAVPGGIFTKGQFLVSSEGISDPRFAETVILMLDHDATGAMGLIVNKVIGDGPLESFLKGFDVAPENPSADFRGRRLSLYYGGPVEADSVFVVHGTDYTTQSTRKVAAGLAVSSRIEVLQDMAAGKGPKRYRIMLGYSGWGAGQLEGEMARHDWVTAPAVAADVFADDAEAVWARVIKGAGLAL